MGYAVKKVAKVVAVIIGLFFLGLQYMAYKGIIDVNYGALEEWGANALGSTVAAEGVLAAMIANLPFAASFVLGFGMGLRMG